MRKVNEPNLEKRMRRMRLAAGPLLDDTGFPLRAAQKVHTKIYNERGLVMASMPDCYEAGKNGQSTVLRSLRSGLDEAVISSTVVTSVGCFDVVTHYFGSTVVRPIKRKIPEKLTRNSIVLFGWRGGNDFSEDERVLCYLQALFDTDDDASTIENTLRKLTPPRRIYELLIPRKIPAGSHAVVRFWYDFDEDAQYIEVGVPSQYAPQEGLSYRVSKA